MKVPLHTDHGVAGDMAKDQVALVTLHCKKNLRERERKKQSQMQNKFEIACY
jgi:hypothetical protein